MSGAAMMAMGMRLITVTIGTLGDLYGFVSGSFGSISPSSVRTNDGTVRTIVVIDWDDAGNTLNFQLQGVLTNSDAAMFKGIIVNGTTFLRSAATFSTGSNSNWQWAQATNIIGASGTARVVVF